MAIMKIIRRLLIGLVAIALVAYVGVLGYIYLNQRALEYDTTGRMFELSETKLTNAQLVSIPSSDGSAVAGWYAPPAAGMPVILYFRGNSQSFSREHERYERFAADGYGFLAFDYRGFPGSPGQLTQANVLADSLAAFDWLKAKGFPILLWGRSLGSGPASYVATTRDAEALFLETPFISAVQVAVDRYWYLPVGLLMADQYPVDHWIREVTEPVFIAHGDHDQTIDVYHGKRLYELARNPQGLWIEPGADHDELWAHGIWDKAKAFFQQVEAAKTGAANENGAPQGAASQPAVAGGQ
jgi:fermentation-respiration switch protein FrsA (DUF1100 family)